MFKNILNQIIGFCKKAEINEAPKPQTKNDDQVYFDIINKEKLLPDTYRLFVHTESLGQINLRVFSEVKNGVVRLYITDSGALRDLSGMDILGFSKEIARLCKNNCTCGSDGSIIYSVQGPKLFHEELQAYLSTLVFYQRNMQFTSDAFNLTQYINETRTF